MARRNRNNGSMTVREAGQKGGRATSDKYGPGFYKEIGSQSHKNDPGKSDNY